MPDPQIQKLIDDLKTKKFREGEAKGLIQTIGDEIKKQLGPLFSAHSKEITDSVKGAFKDLKIDVPKQDAPQVNMPEFPQIPPFPEMKAPVVNIPAPIVNVPAPHVTVQPTPVNFPSSMKLEPNAKPFPVIMMDQGGKPMLFPTMGSSGPGFPMQTLDAANNAIRVSGSFSISASNSSTQAIDSSGNVYSQANPMPVVFSSSGTTASALVDSSGVQYSGTNPLPTTASLSVPVGQGDSASALRTIQAGDSVSSVVVNSGTITTVTTLTGITNTIGTVQLDRDGNPWQPETFGQGDSATAMRIIQAGDSVSSVVVNSGTITTVSAVTGITNSIAAMLLDESGAIWQPFTYGPGDGATAQRVLIAGDSPASVIVNSGTITTVTTLTGVTNTVNVRLDTPDGLYSAANPLPVSVASSITQNVTVAGVTDSTFIHQARTTNPTPVTDGADVRPKADKLGRTLTRPMQVRDLIRTAYVTLSTGTEATLITAAAGTFYDCIWIAFANTSTAAVQVDVRAVTAGNIVHSAYIPANSTIGWAPPVPWPQDATGNNWTVDMGDFTNSNVLITALFSQEI